MNMQQPTPEQFSELQQQNQQLLRAFTEVREVNQVLLKALEREKQKYIDAVRDRLNRWGNVKEPTTTPTGQSTSCEFCKSLEIDLPEVEQTITEIANYVEQMKQPNWQPGE
jgi:hypothetical protein